MNYHKSQEVMECKYIPLEICTQILSYLPVKSLLRFRSVSREWKSTIENRDFTSLHLNHYRNNRLETYVIAKRYIQRHWPAKYRNMCFSRCPGTQDYRHTSEVVVPESLFPGNSVLNISGYIDGLVLVHKAIHEAVIWNPSLRKTLNIPLPRGPRPSTMLYTCLGFDPSTKDYKIVSMDYSFVQRYITIDIFSLNSHSWKSRDNERLTFTDGENKAYFEGSINWVGYVYDDGFVYDDNDQWKKGFVSFNMTSETFSLTPLPNMSSDPHGERFEGPVVLAGSLIGLLTSYKGNTEIFVLESDGSWSKRFKFDSRIQHVYSSWLRFNKHAVLICKFKGEQHDSGDEGGVDSSIFSFYINPKDRSILLQDTHGWWTYIGTYVESLLLLS